MLHVLPRTLPNRTGIGQAFFQWRGEGSLVATAALLAGLLAVWPVTLSWAGSGTLREGDSDGLRKVHRDEEWPYHDPAYSRGNYIWPYATGPYYGKAATGAGSRAPGMLVTMVGTFDLRSGAPEIPPALTTPNRLNQLGAQYFIVQLDPETARIGALDTVRRAIEDHGGAIVHAMPVMALVVRMTAPAMKEVQTAAGVTAILPYHAAFKLDPLIGRTPLPDPLEALSEVYDLDVRIFRDENAETVAGELARLGGNVKSVFPDTIRVEIHRSKLHQVASLDPVHTVFENVPIRMHAEETTTTVQTGAYNSGATPYHDAGIDGGGGGIAPGPQVLMILDSGIQLDAGDLSDTRTSSGTPGPGHRKVRRYGPTDPYGGIGDTEGCDALPSGGFTHGHMVAATALGNATAVDPAYGAPWWASDLYGGAWRLDGVAKGAVLVAFDGQITPAAVACPDPMRNTSALATISPGDLYSGLATGSLGDSYENDGARIVNFSWGSLQNSYATHAQDIDQFLLDKQDSLVFVSAGNAGLDADNDGVPDAGRIGDPATTKNGLVIGASRAANDLAGGAEENERAFFSGTGPGPAPVNRIVPQLMAPGDEQSDAVNMGLRSEWSCRTNDNDPSDPVECDVVSGKEGTSIASAAAAGAGLLVRDYFAQGFYPDGTADNAGNASELVADISGALVKSVLIASAQYMTGDRPPAFTGSFPGGDNLTALYRFNNEQGYGRVQLDNALPLESWPNSATGLVVADGGIDGGRLDISGLTGSVNILPLNETDEGTIEVCDPDQELRIALSWFDVVGAALVNDLNLEVESPSGKVYHGNYFTDDDDRNGVIDLITEDCPGIDGEIGTVSSTQWSLPVCVRGSLMPSPHDTENPTEAIMLSPDPLGDEDPLNNQVETGTWTIRVIGALGTSSAQRYAVAIAGGVCAHSSVLLDAVDYSCNAEATVTVIEKPEAADPVPIASQVSDRTTVHVISGSTVVDEETGLCFTRTANRYTSASLVLSADTARDPGNGALDVRDGDILRVTYQDVGPDGQPDANNVRTSSSTVTCATRLGFGNLVFAQFGRDTAFFVSGGCERSARGKFEFGFPDRYMDAGETLSYNFAFASAEPIDLYNVEVGLHCVLADADSPEGCRPSSADCGDPHRLNNASCDQVSGCAVPPCSATDAKLMEILDTPKTIGFIAAESSLSANFSVQMEPAIAGQPEIEMILQVKTPVAGKKATAIAVSRHTADADELSFFYSTDFPFGGTQVWDMNDANRGNEILEDPNTNLGFMAEDYVFETREWDSMGGTNPGLQSPWNFEVTDGGFHVGLLATTDERTITNPIAQWGEDKNFNGIDDKVCNNDITIACDKSSDCPQVGVCMSVEQRAPADTVLDKSWNTRGGCGWQTKAPNTCSGNPTLACFQDADCGPFAPCNGAAPASGGIWHTGRIGATTSGLCLVTGSTPGQCRAYDTVAGASGLLSWREHLVTPVMEKVNDSDYTVEMLHWRWNQAIDLADSNAALAWELDTDVDAIEPVDLFSDNTVLGFLFGPYGAVEGRNNPNLTNGYSMFAPLDDSMATSVNGVQGNNREGKNSCYFEGGNVGTVLCPLCPWDPGDLGWAGPLDNDIDDDTDGTIDEYVTTNGPVRNMDISAVNGPDMRFDKLEDLYGDTGERWQASVGFWAFEANLLQAPPSAGYGVGIDDMVVEWREFRLAGDDSNCGLSCTLDTSIACTTDAQCSGNGVCGGECAVLDLVSSNAFEGSFSLTITVLEPTPPLTNDCDLDGTPDGGPTDPDDCDDDGTPDVPVRATSNAESLGEIVYANSVGGDEYKGHLPVSAGYNSPGVLFVAQVGTENPVVTAAYFDADTGAGNICHNNADPGAQGSVTATTRLFLDTGDVVVVSATLDDNGDQDGFADSNETVDMRLTLTNKSDQPLTNLSARLTTNDPKIDGILNTAIDIGDVAPGQVLITMEAFLFHVADLNRSNVCTGDTLQSCIIDADCAATGTGTCGLTDLEDFSADFQVLFSADQFDSTARPQLLTLDLDLDALGGAGPTSFAWDVPNDDFGPFEAVNIDAGRNNAAGSDGYRCQYSDPDWIGSNSYGAITDCFLGASGPGAAAFHWQIHTPVAVDGGKAYSWPNSLYMGIFGPAPDEHTTPLAVLEAVALTDPINLGSASSELSFVQQASLVDSRTVNAPPGEAPARGVVQLQLADPFGVPVGNWIKLEPYLNVYDQQGADNYFNCVFDPVDDGNTEDDFFDPTDPNRRLGPSSTCKSEFSFVHMGDTFRPYAEGNLGNAEGPGLAGALGNGTWVESKFNLERFRGRRIRLRFLNTDLKAGSFETWENLLVLNPNPGDDGWWIDDVIVTNTLVNPMIFTNDNKNNSGLPGVGPNCTLIDADLRADPPGVRRAPGRAVTLTARGSTADRCLNGVLLFRFYENASLLRDWTDNPQLRVAPQTTTDYAVDVRCSTATSCVGSAGHTVTVSCPSSGELSFPIVRAEGKNELLFTTRNGPPVITAFNYVMGPLFGACSVGGNPCTSDSDCDDGGDLCQGGLQAPYMTTGSGADLVPSDSFNISSDHVSPPDVAATCVIERLLFDTRLACTTEADCPDLDEGLCTNDGSGCVEDEDCPGFDDGETCGWDNLCGEINGFYYLFRTPGFPPPHSFCNDPGASWGPGGPPDPPGATRDDLLP